MIRSHHHLSWLHLAAGSREGTELDVGMQEQWPHIPRICLLVGSALLSVVPTLPFTPGVLQRKELEIPPLPGSTRTDWNWPGRSHHLPGHCQGKSTSPRVTSSGKSSQTLPILPSLLWHLSITAVIQMPCSVHLPSGLVSICLPSKSAPSPPPAPTALSLDCGTRFRRG